MFRRRQFLHGPEDEGSGLPDAVVPPRRPAHDRDDWGHPAAHQLGMFLNGEEIATPDARGRRVVDDSFLLLFNAHYEDAGSRCPPARFGRVDVVLRPAHPDEPGRATTFAAGAPARRWSARSLVLLRRASA